jgi:MYXO-CTERM domain-containing protein
MPLMRSPRPSPAQPPRRKWPWVLALLAGGGAWAIWRAGKQAEQESAPTKDTDRTSR